MKNCTKRWLYLLAGSSLSAKEIREVCAWLASSPDDIVALVKQLRRQEISVRLAAEEAEENVRVVPSRRSSPASPAERSGVAERAVAEIVRILRTESRLSAREAATRLALELRKELRRQSTAAPDIPAYSKEDFRTYVRKLLKHTTPQMLLHLAHRIRDRVVGRPAPAWPLRRGPYADGR